MRTKPRISRIELIEFDYGLNDVGREPTIGIPIYQPGNTRRMRANAIRIDTEADYHIRLTRALCYLALRQPTKAFLEVLTQRQQEGHSGFVHR